MEAEDRIDWKWLAEHYPTMRTQGSWIKGLPWFGFDITHSRITGTEPLLMAMMTDPEWVHDMFSTQLEISLALLEMVWQRGYTFDVLQWPDDMGYKFHQFFSIDTYRELLKPLHKKAVDWAHAHGIRAHLHSCGDVNPFVPELIDIGMDGLHPLEVKAGMDPVHLKKTYGDKILFHGGVNAVLWDQPDKIIDEINRVVPVMKENGGYIFSSDHSVPDAVSLEDFRRIVGAAKKAGKY